MAMALSCPAPTWMSVTGSVCCDLRAGRDTGIFGTDPAAVKVAGRACSDQVCGCFQQALAIQLRGVAVFEIEGPHCMQQVSPGVPRVDGLLLHAGLMCLSIEELHQGPAVGCRVLPATEQEAAVLGESQGCHCLQTGMSWLRPLLQATADACLQA